MDHFFVFTFEGESNKMEKYHCPSVPRCGCLLACILPGAGSTRTCDSGRAGLRSNEQPPAAGAVTGLCGNLSPTRSGDTGACRIGCKTCRAAASGDAELGLVGMVKSLFEALSKHKDSEPRKKATRIASDFPQAKFTKTTRAFKQRTKGPNAKTRRWLDRGQLRGVARPPALRPGEAPALSPGGRMVLPGRGSVPGRSWVPPQNRGVPSKTGGSLPNPGGPKLGGPAQNRGVQNRGVPPKTGGSKTGSSLPKPGGPFQNRGVPSKTGGSKTGGKPGGPKPGVPFQNRGVPSKTGCVQNRGVPSKTGGSLPKPGCPKPGGPFQNRGVQNRGVPPQNREVQNRGVPPKTGGSRPKPGGPFQNRGVPPKTGGCLPKPGGPSKTGGSLPKPGGPAQNRGVPFKTGGPFQNRGVPPKTGGSRPKPGGPFQNRGVPPKTGGPAQNRGVPSGGPAQNRGVPSKTGGSLPKPGGPFQKRDLRFCPSILTSRDSVRHDPRGVPLFCLQVPVFVPRVELVPCGPGWEGAGCLWPFASLSNASLCLL